MLALVLLINFSLRGFLRKEHQTYNSMKFRVRSFVAKRSKRIKANEEYFEKCWNSLRGNQTEYVIDWGLVIDCLENDGDRRCKPIEAACKDYVEDLGDIFYDLQEKVVDNEDALDKVVEVYDNVYELFEDNLDRLEKDAEALYDKYEPEVRKIIDDKFSDHKPQELLDLVTEKIEEYTEELSDEFIDLGKYLLERIKKIPKNLDLVKIEREGTKLVHDLAKNAPAFLATITSDEVTNTMLAFGHELEKTIKNVGNSFKREADPLVQRVFNSFEKVSKNLPASYPNINLSFFDTIKKRLIKDSNVTGLKVIDRLEKYATVPSGLYFVYQQVREVIELSLWDLVAQLDVYVGLIPNDLKVVSTFITEVNSTVFDAVDVPFRYAQGVLKFVKAKRDDHCDDLHDLVADLACVQSGGWFATKVSFFVFGGLMILSWIFWN